MVVSSRTRLLAVLGIIAYFTIGYGIIGYTHHYASWNASTALDAAIPFIPAFIIFYFLGDILLFLPIFLIDDERAFRRMMLGFFGMMTVAYACFLAFPIEFPKAFLYDNSMLATLAHLQHANDTAYNNFPSLHVAFTLYAWLLISEKRIKALTAPVVLCIIASVLLVKQHLIIDVIGGVLLAIGAFLWWRHISEKIREDGAQARTGAQRTIVAPRS